MKFYDAEDEADDRPNRRRRKKLKYREKTRKHGYTFCMIVQRLQQQRADEAKKVLEGQNGNS